MRRTVPVAVAATMLFAATICAGSEQAPGILPSGLGKEVDRGLEQLRKATAPFRSVDQARAAGYEQETECVERQPEGAMGYRITAWRCKL